MKIQITMGGSTVEASPALLVPELRAMLKREADAPEYDVITLVATLRNGETVTWGVVEEDDEAN